MTRRLLPLLLLAALLLVPTSPGHAAGSGPVHTVRVEGAGTTTFPAFDPAIERYAVRPSAETGGSVRVTAETSDPDARVTANGRPLPGGSGMVTGLEPGDEVAVVVQDAGGTHRHTYIYLPVDFPVLRRTRLSLDQPSEGHVLLTMGLLDRPSYFEMAVDPNGVPAIVSSQPHAMDLKRQPNGNYSSSRGVDGPAGSVVVELDEQFREVGRRSTVGLVHTDPHDSILLADGSAYLLAYEPDPETGRTDSVVQHVSSTGEVLFQWNTRDHVDVGVESVEDPAGDYAHVNSVEIMDDGDLLLSFRHLSSVFKVARHAREGVRAGDVVWKLGGRDSDFTFTDTSGSPDGGPCAQHTATELPNGNIMVFDNGAWAQNPLCIDPVSVAGPLVPRVPSRIAEWALDPATGAARMVRDHRVDGRYAIFAGGVQPLDHGGVMVGWGSARPAVASELDESGQLVWDLQAVDAPSFFTYRAFKTEVPDRIRPEIVLPSAPTGAEYIQRSATRPAVTCTDRGGSSLRDCQVTGFDTSMLGSRTYTVTATDAAGNSTTVQQSYTVVPPAVHRADGTIKLLGSTRFKGARIYGVTPRQRVDASLAARGRTRTAVVRVHNRGNRPDRFVVRGPASTRTFAVTTQGVHRSPVIAPGGAWTFRVVVKRLRPARRGDAVLVRIRVSSVLRSSARDEVRFGVQAR